MLFDYMSKSSDRASFIDRVDMDILCVKELDMFLLTSNGIIEGSLKHAVSVCLSVEVEMR